MSNDASFALMCIKLALGLKHGSTGWVSDDSKITPSFPGNHHSLVKALIQVKEYHSALIVFSTSL